MDLNGQPDISKANPMPIQSIEANVGDSDTETLVWFYVATDAWVAAVGELAGTIVTGTIDKKMIANSMLTAPGRFNDKFFSLASADRFDNEIEIEDAFFSELQDLTPADQAANILRYLTANGDFAIDCSRGQFWGRSKAVVADDLATYGFLHPIAPTPSGTTLVDLEKIGGVAVNVNGGNRDTGTQTVTLADDDPAVVSLAAIDAALGSPAQAGEAAAAASGLALDATLGTPAQAGEAASAAAALATESGGNLDTIAGDTTSIDGKTPALGQAAKAASVPVTMASDQPVIDVGGDVADGATDAGKPISIGGIGRSAQRTAVSALQRVRATFNLFGELVIAGYTWATNSIRTEEINPISQQFVTETFTLTNVPNATPAEIIIPMDGFNGGCEVQVEKTGGTDTFVWTMESSGQGSAPTDTFEDTTQFGFNSATVVGAATYTADGILYAVPGRGARAHKVKLETSGTADDSDYVVTIKKFN